jgi:YesN/AraC family two-component response regulator
MSDVHHVAIVDDEEAVHTIFKARFRKQLKEGIIVFHHFLDGHDCYKHIEESKGEVAFVLLLSDINMPVMDGLTLLKKIKENYPKLDVCMCSAYDTDEYINKAKDLGASDYIEKPLDFKRLKEVISSKLGIEL